MLGTAHVQYVGSAADSAFSAPAAQGAQSPAAVPGAEPVQP
jgi:hypothetical protein